MMTHDAKRLVAFGCLATVLGGCAAPPEPGQAVDNHTDQRAEQAQTALPALVTCHAGIRDDNSEYVTCTLSPDLPLDVGYARLDVSHRSGGTGGTLTAEEPSRTFSIPSLVSEINIDVEARLDTSLVAGLPDTTTVEGKLVVEPADDEPAEPVRFNMPFDVWDVHFIAEHAPLAGGTIAPYTLVYGDTALAIAEVALPEVPLGEMRSLKLAFTPESEVETSSETDEAAPTEIGLPVTAFIGIDADEPARVETLLVGRGAYVVGPEGLTHAGPHADGLPVAALCWLDEATHLRCQPGEAAGWPAFMVEISVVGANGRTLQTRATYLREQDEIIWETEGSDGYQFAQLDGVDTLLDLGPIDPAMYPLQLDIAAQPDNRNPGIDVAGFEDDDLFVNRAVMAGFLVEDTTDLRPELPAMARFPFDLWEVTIEKAGSPVVVHLAPDYVVNLTSAWDGHEAGQALPLSVWDKTFRQGETSMTFLLPVSAGAAEASMLGRIAGGPDQLFTLKGPGVYLATPEGVVPAGDRP